MDPTYNYPGTFKQPQQEREARIPALKKIP